MDEQSFFSQVTPTTYSILALLAVVLVTLVKTWPAIKGAVLAAKNAERHAESSLLDRYEDRFKYLEEAERRCQQELANVTRRLAELEGFDEGQGRARQDAQRMLSGEREKDRYRKKDDK